MFNPYFFTLCVVVSYGYDYLEDGGLDSRGEVFGGIYASLEEDCMYGVFELSGLVEVCCRSERRFIRIQ